MVTQHCWSCANSRGEGLQLQTCVIKSKFSGVQIIVKKAVTCAYLLLDVCCASSYALQLASNNKPESKAYLKTG